ncbi:hypothetical protein [Cohnella silvisoli]|uniref:Uncharacterized protein n=1 Tax=Cohnella silvisoli TaxID=2873699 RepID=A0ABV1KYX6_9BACL|nr:hypothetical protein [Cohnella silvisoli]MCD9024165.1 hypothetical protein [Cohnella silvisoli]
MTTLAWSPALRHEVKRLKFLRVYEDERSLSSIQQAGGSLSDQEKRAVDKTFSAKASDQANTSYDYWM